MGVQREAAEGAGLFPRTETERPQACPARVSPEAPLRHLSVQSRRLLCPQVPATPPDLSRCGPRASSAQLPSPPCRAEAAPPVPVRDVSDAGPRRSGARLGPAMA